MKISHFHDSGRLEWKCERLGFGRDASYTLNEIWWKASNQQAHLGLPGTPPVYICCPRGRGAHINTSFDYLLV
jgi:hypothetical protein